MEKSMETTTQGLPVGFTCNVARWWSFDVFCGFGQRFDRVVWRLAECYLSCRLVQGIQVSAGAFFQDSEFEQGLEMLTVGLAFSYILLRFAGAPWTQLLTSLHSFFRVPLMQYRERHLCFQCLKVKGKGF